MSTYIQVHIYIHTYKHIHTCIHEYMHTCMHAYIHTSTCIHEYVHTYVLTYTHTYTHSHSLSLSLSPNVLYIKIIKSTHLIKICKFYLQHFRQRYTFNNYVVQGNCKKSRHLELRETVNIQSIVGFCFHHEWIRSSGGNRETLQPLRNVRPNNKCSTYTISEQYFQSNVANHCGATFHEVNIFLLEKFGVNMSISSSQANVHALQYVTTSQHGVYYRYILCSVVVTDL
jgi:hypothetical protein